MIGCGRMAVAAAHRSGDGRGDLQRLCVTLILLLAFTLQSYITQVHVHPSSGADDRAAMVKLVGPAPGHGAAPGGEGKIPCPFCQAMLIAGAFFTPTTPILVPQLAWAGAHVPSPIAVGLAVTAASFSWRSRAPPQP